MTGIDAAGAILTTGNAQIDPVRACLGLSDAAERAGALLFEHTPVGRMRGDRRGIDVEVGRRRVRASWAIVATGYATPPFKPLAARFRMVDTYVIATPPLPPGRARSSGLAT